jgi:hypothetical protein
LKGVVKESNRLGELRKYRKEGEEFMVELAHWCRFWGANMLMK